ncbi:MAG: hypothetical protein HPY45_02495 [Anaerolineae bacterium]|nr:hypothetical protein [Anaerolineae bacterium]
MQNTNQPPETIQIEPYFLDFGKFDPNAPLTQLPSVQLKITNAGEDILTGQLLSRMSWLIISPVKFTCEQGATSTHSIQLSTGTPTPLNLKKYSYSDLVLISTNHGDFSIGGSFEIGSMKPGEQVSLPWKYILLPVLLVIVIAALLYVLVVPRKPAPSQTTQIDLLYTYGAETVIVGLTHTSLAQPTLTSTSAFAVKAPFDTLSLSPIPDKTATFTPFPPYEYPNPEQFVYEYYDALNKRDYEKAWSMLSIHFQRNCCEVGGNDPFIVYKSWWSRVEKVEVLSAYLQEYNANPARLNVALRYTYKDGKVTESLNIFWLIADSSRRTLLIYEVR